MYGTISNMQKQPSVAVVIPVYNEEEVIEGCLLSCVKQTIPFSEIIVVNNLSTDNTELIVKNLQKKYPQITLIQQNKAQGITPTRDKGFNAAKADIIGRIDADTILDRRWVRAVRDTFKDENVSAASGPVLYHDMPLPKLGLVLDEKIRSTLHKMAKNHRFLFGTNMAIRRTTWRKVRGLILPDPDNEQHEDISIALALFQNDFEIVYTPEMQAGMSARRIEDKPRDFYRYVMRFENTFRAYGVKSTSARIPIAIYLLIYFPVRTIRKFYDHENGKFTLEKLRDDMSQIKLSSISRRKEKTAEEEPVR